MTLRRLTSAAYRLDLGHDEWVLEVASALQAIYSAEIHVSTYRVSDGTLEATSLQDPAFKRLSLSTLLRDDACGVHFKPDQHHHAVCWLREGNRMLVAACSKEPDGYSRCTWDEAARVLKHGLHIRAALEESGENTIQENLNEIVETAEPSEPESTPDIWEGLMTGRWSLVDLQETRTGMQIVAHFNSPEDYDPRALSPREREIVRLVAAGYSNKEIAYQTNLSMSAVGSFLQRALEKLHLTSRSQLITLAGLLGVPE